jgi:hypothetical protein
MVNQGSAPGSVLHLFCTMKRHPDTMSETIQWVCDALEIATKKAYLENSSLTVLSLLPHRRVIARNAGYRHFVSNPSTRGPQA